MARGTKKRSIEVEVLTHEEAKRRNIPTAELETLMRDEERSPVQLAYLTPRWGSTLQTP